MIVFSFFLYHTQKSLDIEKVDNSQKIWPNLLFPSSFILFGDFWVFSNINIDTSKSQLFGNPASKIR